ncbi:MAG: LapA family protein [Gammaproteobacteria bacterium]|nr:LapA family protein [Gammaproteobacteria bacterium]
MKLVKLISYVFLLLLVIIAFAIGSENGQLISLNLLFVKVQLPLAFIIYIAFVAGVVATLISYLFKKLFNKSNA